MLQLHLYRFWEILLKSFFIRKVWKLYDVQDTVLPLIRTIFSNVHTWNILVFQSSNDFWFFFKLCGTFLSSSLYTSDGEQCLIGLWRAFHLLIRSFWLDYLRSKPKLYWESSSRHSGCQCYILNSWCFSYLILTHILRTKLYNKY